MIRFEEGVLLIVLVMATACCASGRSLKQFEMNYVPPPLSGEASPGKWMLAEPQEVGPGCFGPCLVGPTSPDYWEGSQPLILTEQVPNGLYDVYLRFYHVDSLPVGVRWAFGTDPNVALRSYRAVGRPAGTKSWHFLGQQQVTDGVLGLVIGPAHAAGDASSQVVIDSIKTPSACIRISLSDPVIVQRAEKDAREEPEGWRAGYGYTHLSRAADGGIWCFYAIAPDDGKPHDKPIGYNVSYDEGRTWSPMRVLPFTPEPVSRVVPTFVSLADGTMLMLASRVTVTDDPEMWLGTVYRSFDNGKTWEATPNVPVRFPKERMVRDNLLPDPTEPAEGAYPSGSQLWIFDHVWDPQTQSILVTANIGMSTGTAYRALLLQSRDEGRSWEYIGTMMGSKPAEHMGYTEPTVERAACGALVALARTEYSSPAVFLAQALSFDDGQTWTDPIVAPGTYGCVPWGGHSGGCVTPDLLQLANGVLVGIWARPGTWLGFSINGDASRWTNTIMLTEPYAEEGCGASDLLALSANEFLVSWDQWNYRTEPNDPGRNTVFCRRVKVERLDK